MDTPADEGRRDARARERILDAAEQLFAAHGFDGTATARIAKAAAVPKGLLFYYFPAKSDLLQALFDERLQPWVVEPEELAHRGDPVASLMDISQMVFDHHDGSAILRTILWREAHTRADARAAAHRYRSMLQQTIADVLAASVIDPVKDTVLHAAAATWTTIMTSRPLDNHSESGLPVTANLRAIAELIARGLHAPQPATP